ncbi:MAG: MFS transporter [Gammaproteobacteria bacterium]|nr:MFS transporter [Gammaproteobacteria bacterium]
MEMLNLSETKTQWIVWTLLCLMPIIGMCIDLVAPSLPAIASDFNVINHMAQNVISFYLLGYALGNFLSGFLIDAYGRQKIIRFSLFGFIVASLLPIIFHNMSLLFFARVMQGLTIGAVSVTLRAICADVLPPEKLTKLGPWFGAMWGLGPIFGPVIGGYFQVYFGWQAGFYFFGLIGLIAFIAVYIIVPETHLDKHPLQLSRIKKDVFQVLCHPVFMGITMLMGLTYSLLIIFNVAGPFLIQGTMHYSPIFFGHVAFFLGVVFVGGTFFGKYLLKKHSVEKIWLVGINLSLLVGIISFVISYVDPQSVVLTVFISALMFISCGVLFPLSLGKGLSLFRHVAGTATAVMYLVNISISSLSSYFVGFFKMTSLIELSSMYLFLVAVIALLYWTLLKRS